MYLSFHIISITFTCLPNHCNFLQQSTHYEPIGAFREWIDLTTNYET
jgi:hypothetical protein